MPQPFKANKYLTKTDSSVTLWSFGTEVENKTDTGMTKCQQYGDCEPGTCLTVQWQDVEGTEEWSSYSTEILDAVHSLAVEDSAFATNLTDDEKTLIKGDEKSILSVITRMENDGVTYL